MADPKPRAPVANPMPSFWNGAPKPLDDHRTTASLPSTADVVIIGAGFAGVATAYHLLQQSPPPQSIVILEARGVCSGATGRNGGHVKPDMYFNIPKYSAMYGERGAAALAAFEREHVFAVKELVEREGLDQCEFHLTRAVDVFLKEEHGKSAEREYRRLRERGVVDLRDVSFTGKRDAERISGIKGAQCCFTYTAAHLWPSKLVHQLLQRLLATGRVNLQSHTPVSSIEPCSSASPSSSFPDAAAAAATPRWTVRTATRGAISARHVVHATNGYVSSLLPEYAGRVVPVRGVCSHLTSPTLGAKTPHLNNTYGIRFDERNNDYLIPRADGSIVVGGARQRFWHDRGAWFDSVRDDELVRDTRGYFEGYMQRVFRGWESSGMEVGEVWTGILGYSSDYMPHVGAVPDKPGQYIIAGFSGHGMPQILLSSKGLAGMMADEKKSFATSGMPPMFETTKERITAEGSPLEDGLRPLWEQGSVEKESVKSKL